MSPSMLKTFSNYLCLIRQPQQQPSSGGGADPLLFSAESIANALDRDPSLRAAFDRALQAQLEEEIKKKGESSNELPDTR